MVAVIRGTPMAASPSSPCADVSLYDAVVYPSREGRVASSASAEIAGWGEATNARYRAAIEREAPTPVPPRAQLAK